jgi:rhodanese-related sulfurtransferase
LTVPGNPIPTVTVADVVAAREKASASGASEPILLDVRGSGEFAQVRVAGAALMPLPVVTARFRELPSDRPIHVICHSGNRSAMVTQFLLAAGYSDVANVAGGMIAWLRAGYPAVSGTPTEGEGELRP